MYHDHGKLPVISWCFSCSGAFSLAEYLLFGMPYFTVFYYLLARIMGVLVTLGRKVGWM